MSEAARPLRTAAVPNCPVCGAGEEPVYEGLRDVVFGVPGNWRMVRCAAEACGLHWLDPAPTTEDLGLAYRDYYTHASPPVRSGAERWLRRWMKEGYYAWRFGYRVRAAFVKRAFATALILRPGLRAGLDRLIMGLEPHPGGRALDVGCGSGATLAQLRDLGWQVEGVDFDPAAVAAARERGLEVQLGSLEEQRYPAARFDAITVSHVLEHVPNPVGLLSEARRILAPGGVLVAFTPNARSLGHRRHLRHWRGLEPPRHLQIFSSQALERAVGRAGFARFSVRSVADGAEFVEAESLRIERGGAVQAADQSASRAFAREERRVLAADPWAGEELMLVAHAD